LASRVSQEVLEAVAELQPNVRISQDTVEVVLFPAGVRVTQDVVEAVIAPAGPNVRATQEVVEVVIPSGAPPEEPAAFIVRAAPRVYQGFRGVPEDEDGIVVEDPHHPRGKFRVIAHPQIAWGGDEFDPYNRFFVQCRPEVAYVTGPGTASTECISAPGVVPPPEEPPAESLEQNYVF
jgi:hypothetical protein